MLKYLNNPGLFNELILIAFKLYKIEKKIHTFEIPN